MPNWQAFTMRLHGSVFRIRCYPTESAQFIVIKLVLVQTCPRQNREPVCQARNKAALKRDITCGICCRSIGQSSKTSKVLLCNVDSALCAANMHRAVRSQKGPTPLCRQKIQSLLFRRILIGTRYDCIFHVNF